MNESGGSIVWNLDINDSNFKAGLANARSAAASTAASVEESLGKKLSTLGTSLYRTGSEISRTVTLPVVALGTAIFKTSADFEESLNKIVGLVGISRTQVNAWKGDFEDLAIQTGKTPNDLAQAMFFITSAGLRGQKALDALTASAKASAAGLGDTATVADAVTSAVNSYAKSNLSASRATDILAAAVKAGKVDASTIAPVLGNILPIAASLKVRFEDVAGAMASMTRVGLDAATAGTSIRGVLSALIKPGKQAKDALSGVGLNFQDLRDILAKPGGIIQVMRLLNEKFGDNEEAMAHVIPDVRAFRGVMAVLAQDSGSVDNVMGQVANSVGLTNKAFQAASEGPGFKFHQIMAQISGDLIKIGDVVAPIIASGMQTIGKAFSTISSTFDNLPKSVQKTIVFFLGLAAAVGPMLLVTGALIRLMGNFGEALGAIEKHPIIFALTTLATILIYLQARFDILSKASNILKRAFSDVDDVLNRDLYPILKDIEKFFRTVFHDAVNIGKRVLDDFTGAIKVSVRWLDTHRKAIEHVAYVLGVIFGPALIKVGVQSAITAAGMVIDATKAGVAWVVQAAQASFAWIVEFGKMLIQSFLTGIKMAADAVVAGAAWILQAIKSSAQWVIEFGTMVVKAVATAVVMAAQAAIAGYAWILQAGQASAAWVASAATSGGAVSGFRALVASPIVMGAIGTAGALADIALVTAAVISVRGAIDAMNNAKKAVVDKQASDLAVIAQLGNTIRTGTPAQVARAREVINRYQATGHFAEGTDFAPGGLAIVGEKGPELVNLPKGSQVIPNNKINKIRDNVSITQNNSIFNQVDLDQVTRDLAWRLQVR